MERFENDFNDWLEKNYYHTINRFIYHEQGLDTYLASFKELPLSMQWGVYVDFFDEHGILIEIGKNIEPDVLGDWWLLINTNEFGVDYIHTRQEARKIAFFKAIEIYNQNT